ncbi:DUF4190 domain-containing protein [Sanguibacter sp. HDW7]|uniref:DUF4190 domain-containing protein n=1 Tax=Sanguibacter sp. HDW7 TaxID=2714931 RepID=UPI00140A9F24|nr:DUF4190 domain-containing protein [Sanguibacter sp. HDW7]QIK84012.1 DUF4190 domain-containing protein [Sanguibacter sp. HDW7]
MTTERRGAPGRSRDGARTAVASVVAGVLMTGPVALVLGVASLVARPAAAVRRLAIVGCALGILGTAAWGLWGASLQGDVVPSAAAAPVPTPVRLALPSTAITTEMVTEDSLGYRSEATEKASTGGTVTIEDLDGMTEVPVLGTGTGLVLSLPLEIEKFATDGWTVVVDDGATESMQATFTRNGTAVAVVVTLHPTSTDAEAMAAGIVRDRLEGADTTEGKTLAAEGGAIVRRVVHDGRTTFVWSEFTASVEVDGPTGAARVLVDRFRLGPGEQPG